MTFGEKIKKYRKNLRMTQDELAKLVGYNDRSSIAKIESGNRDVPQSIIIRFAEALGVTPAELVDDQNDDIRQSNIIPLPKFRKIPIVGTIACVEPVNREETGEVNVPINIKADCALICRGDSMKNIGVKNGDIVYILRQPTVESGQIAAVAVGDEYEYTLKRLYYYADKNKIVLFHENPDFEPMVFIGEEINDIHILGRAVGYTSRL